jgi:hypothetical protein
MLIVKLILSRMNDFQQLITYPYEVRFILNSQVDEVLIKQP